MVKYNDNREDKTGAEKERVVEAVSMADMQSNINYVTEFYDVSSAQLGTIFDQILAAVLGQVFVPITGDNDAGVSNAITYQDPLGEYMEIKSQSITATPHHVTGSDTSTHGPTTFDMALLLFGEMHGLVRTGIYDFQWNDDWMNAHKGDPAPGGGTITPGSTPFPMGWYEADAGPEDATMVPVGSNGLPAGCSSAEDAWNNGYVFRLNNQALVQYVPIVQNPSGEPGDLIEQAKNTVYTLYRFAGDEDNRNELRRNPAYGEVPQELKDQWKKEKEEKGQYPVDDALYRSTPGVYRLSDIRVWVEDTGDFVDTTGAFTPQTGYDRSLYLNVPAAAIPTELATITLGADEVMSYKTNLPADHSSLELDSQYSEENWKKYCYQSTPLRLFYAVGLEEDLIQRDGSGTQRGVDVSALSTEYVREHTDPATGDIWFISNYYSATPFGEYVTDDQRSRTRGDPTITFSPSSENRYYVFQKPLPLFAHAYRVHGGKLTPVDKESADIWTDVDNERGNGYIPPNSSTPVWETVDGVQQRPGAWVGGLYMGVYADEDAFNVAYEAAKDTKTITDANKTQYPLVEGGIVFLEDDLMTDTTSKSGVTLSSDDYFFLLVEYYLPDDPPDDGAKGGYGVDNEGNPVAGTRSARFVQRVVARKGSEFGSAFQSGKIVSADMLCWTNVGHSLNAEFPFLSGVDNTTFGKPDWQKLTFDKGKLESYLTPMIADEVIRAERVQYWLEKRNDPAVAAALSAADTDHDGNVNEDEFNAYFNFAIAARTGGIRTGDMANNRLSKSANPTGTANSYYLPAVSDNSGTDDDVILNNYLGNNGRLEIANGRLMVTKLLEETPGIPLPDGSDNETFLYQLYVQGLTGEQKATVVFRNPFANCWQRQIGAIDVLTDNHNLVQTAASEPALFIPEGTSDDDRTARQVVLVDGTYYFANEDGTASGEVWDGYSDPDHPENDLYYLYLPPDTEGGTSRRVYQAPVYEGEDKIDEKDLQPGNRMTIYTNTGYTPSEDAGEGIDYANADEAAGRPAGTFAYWAQFAKLIPKSEVDNANDKTDEGWQYNEGSPTKGDYLSLAYHTLVLTKPEQGTSESIVISPFLTRTHYATRTLVFGENANDNDDYNGDAGPHEQETELTEKDLYDGIIPSGDRPDLFGALTNAQIAKNTAEFTLTSGYGLLLTGLSNRLVYRYTEKLTNRQLADGYTLKQLTHVQDAGSQTVYRPGSMPDADDTGVYSVFGDVGSFEEQAHYVNTVIKNALTVEKWLVEDEDAPLTDADRAAAFEFTLSLQDAGGPLNGPFPYVIVGTGGDSGADKVLAHGILYTGDYQEAYGALDKVTAEGVAQTPVKREDDGFWHFKLMDGQTFTVTELPDGKRYAYTVAEAQSALFSPDRETVSKTVDPTVSGAVKANREAFYNRKRPPEPAPVTLLLTKRLIDPCGGYDWRGNPFLFAVMPSQDNPAGDPVRRLSGYDPANNLFTLKTGSDAFAAGRSAVLTVFDRLSYAYTGVYHYSISELIPAAPAQGMRYDTAVYQVTVEVSPAPDAPMQLAAQVTIAQGGDKKASVAFENRCNLPPDLPLTGDDSPVALWLALAALSGLAMCALCAASRKRRASRDR